MNKPISIIIIFLICFSSLVFWEASPVRATTTYLSETFEAFPNSWTYANDTNGRIGVTAEQKQEGSYSWFVNDSAIAQYVYAYKALTSNPTGDYEVNCSFYVSSTVQPLYIMLMDPYNVAAGKHNFKLGLNYSSSNYYIQNCLVDGAPGTWENIAVISSNTWHIINAYWLNSTGKVRYYLDGLKKGSDWTPLSPSLPTRYYFGDASSGSMFGKFFIDALKIDDVSELPDSEVPGYSTIGNSTMFATQSCIFSCLWTDNAELSGYIFGTNNTGTWTNETWVVLSGASAWANVTKTLNNTSGYIIQFEWWANDSSNLWNNTGIQSFTTLGWVVNLYLTYFGNYIGSNGHIAYNGTIVANGTSLVFYNSTTYLRVEAYPDTGSWGNIFESWYKNGTGINNPGTGYSNPVNVLIDANYNIIANWSQQIMILPKFSVNSTSIYVNESISVNATNTWAKVGVLLPYRWNWGDGSAINYSYTPLSDHKYSVTGTYNVTLEIYDTNYATNSITLYSITVIEDTSWYIAPGFILGLVCFMAIGFVFVKKRRD